jgi:hypothetical protein
VHKDIRILNPVSDHGFTSLKRALRFVKQVAATTTAAMGRLWPATASSTPKEIQVLLGHIFLFND